MKPLAHSTGKPLLASWMGGDDVAEGTAILNTAGIPTFSYPDTAARAFTYMWRYTYNLRGLYETPALVEGSEAAAGARIKVSEFVQQVRASGRTLLNEFEAKQLLAHYGIPVVDTRVAENEEQAVAVRAEIGYPVVLKLLSNTIAHKTDVDGVRLRLRTAEEVRGCLPRDSGVGHRESRSGTFCRSHGAADGEARWLRTDPGQHHRCAVWTRHSVWLRRSDGRGLPRPRPGAAAAEHDPGPAPDGADKNLFGAARSAWTQAREPGRARSVAGALQPAGDGTAVDQGDRHQSAAGHAGAVAGARRARGGARFRHAAGAVAPCHDSAVPAAICMELEIERWHAGDDPSDPSGR